MCLFRWKKKKQQQQQPNEEAKRRMFKTERRSAAAAADAAAVLLFFSSNSYFSFFFFFFIYCVAHSFLVLFISTHFCFSLFCQRRKEMCLCISFFFVSLGIIPVLQLIFLYVVRVRSFLLPLLHHLSSFLSILFSAIYKWPQKLVVVVRE